MFESLYPYADKLRFPGEIEKQFREEYHANTVSTTRLALFLGLILIPLPCILDIYAVPISRNIVWFIRYAIVAPYIIYTLIITYTIPSHKHTQLLMCIVITVSGIGIAPINAITQDAEF